MKADRISLDKLSRISEDASWEAFEAQPDGVLALMDRAQTMLPADEELDDRPWVFVMRVGVHLGQPTQAIMSCGNFIRLRRDDRWMNMPLNALDPANPNGCLYYSSHGGNPLANALCGGWKPQPPYYWTSYSQGGGLSTYSTPASNISTISGGCSSGSGSYSIGGGGGGISGGGGYTSVIGAPVWNLLGGTKI